MIPSDEELEKTTNELLDKWDCGWNEKTNLKDLIIHALKSVRDPFVKEIEELKQALIELRIAGGLEAEMAKCFELVIKRDQKIEILKSRVKELEWTIRQYCDEVHNPTAPGALRPSFEKLEQALKKGEV